MRCPACNAKNYSKFICANCHMPLSQELMLQAGVYIPPSTDTSSNQSPSQPQDKPASATPSPSAVQEKGSEEERAPDKKEEDFGPFADELCGARLTMKARFAQQFGAHDLCRLEEDIPPPPEDEEEEPAPPPSEDENASSTISSEKTVQSKSINIAGVDEGSEKTVEENKDIPETVEDIEKGVSSRKAKAIRADNPIIKDERFNQLFNSPRVHPPLSFILQNNDESAGFVPDMPPPPAFYELHKKETPLPEDINESEDTDELPPFPPPPPKIIAPEGEKKGKETVEGCVVVEGSTLRSCSGMVYRMNQQFTPYSTRTTRRIKGVPTIVAVEPTPFNIESLFLVYEDGRLIYSYPESSEVDEETGEVVFDSDIISGMLSAVQMFVSDSFKQIKGALSSIDYGKYEIKIERGVKIYLAVVISGTVPSTFRKNMRKCLIDIRTLNPWLTKEVWDGAYEKWEGVEDIITINLIEKYPKNYIENKRIDPSLLPDSEDLVFPYENLKDEIEKWKHTIELLKDTNIEIEDVYEPFKYCISYYNSGNYEKSAKLLEEVRLRLKEKAAR